MLRKPPAYPFCAVVGQEQAKQALLLHAVHPRLGGVLLSGEHGTSKTILIRGLGELLPERRLVGIPLHVTEDRLLGGLDAEYAMQRGKRRLLPGLIAEADGHALVVDEANLLPERMMRMILLSAEAGYCEIEREGLSERRLSRFLLFGTMNPEEGSSSRELMAGFGMYVRLEAEWNANARMEIIRRRLAYEWDPDGFVQSYEDVTTALRERIEQARDRLPAVQADEAGLRLAAEIVRESGCPGHRADILLVETARAIAAWDDRSVLRTEDLHEAAGYVLPHRMRPEAEAPPPAEAGDGRTSGQAPQTPDGSNHESGTEPRGQPHGDEPSEMPSRQQEGSGEPQGTPDPTGPSVAREIVERIGRDFDVQRFTFVPPQTQEYGGSGKRNKTGAGTGKGRYIRAVTPHGKVRDLAFDATIRAAAPFQRLRKAELSSAEAAFGKIIVTKGDLREKVRESRAGTALLFVVDASGSMNAAKRMKAAKGAILSLLRDAYRQRDSVGMVAFRGDRAELLLDMTRSVELAERRLQVLPTGGKTPLSLGLRKGAETIRSLMRKKSGLVPAMIVITDGKANVCSASGLDPWLESVDIARRIAASGMQTLVIDTEQGFVRLGLARKLSDALHGQYFRLEELEAGRIERIVRTML
ncbi:VWA domain-containing protein [Paenibacillus sp. NPDC056579]|uniref:VWA domain-containing protein n=1 Tax=Paenibacillus sp. NPDC056579 TaxID=3345871 RepID=UPI00369B1851